MSVRYYLYPGSAEVLVSIVCCCSPMFGVLLLWGFFSSAFLEIKIDVFYIGIRLFYDKHTVSRCTLWVFIAVTLEKGIVFFLKKRTTPNRHWIGNLTTNPYVTITHRHNTKTGNCYWILGGPIWVAEINVGPMWVKTIFSLENPLVQ